MKPKIIQISTETVAEGDYFVYGVDESGNLWGAEVVWDNSAKIRKVIGYQWHLLISNEATRVISNTSPHSG